MQIRQCLYLINIVGQMNEFHKILTIEASLFFVLCCNFEYVPFSTKLINPIDAPLLLRIEF